MKDMWAMNAILNLPGHHSIAAISLYLSTFDGEIVISDCHKVITLSLDSYSLEDCINTSHKIDVLHKTISELKNRYDKLRAIRAEYPDLSNPYSSDKEWSKREREMINRIKKVLK